MGKFKVGDRVKVLVGHRNNGETTTITRIEDNRIYFAPVCGRFSDRHEDYYHGDESFGVVEPVSKSVQRDYPHKNQTVTINPGKAYISYDESSSAVGVDYMDVLSAALNREFKADYMKVFGAALNKEFKQENKQVSIVSRAKNLALTPDERLLRKQGLRDECGWTQEALEVLEQKLLDDNRDYLVTIAKDLKAEDKEK